ncbi:MAG: hypothetical protein IKK52_04030 [Alphaproteobacteria bacterium]|nr:hypothetical protein [Alphaproteobacteria bacterium]
MQFGQKQPPKFKIGQKRPAFTIKPPRKVKDVAAFHQGTSIPVTRDNLKDVVEEPCLKACQILFDKNIETMDSGCNGENCSNCAYIIINYDTLSNANRQIADKLVENGKVKFLPKSDVCVRNYFNQIFVSVPTNPEELVSNVEKRLCLAVQDFVPQQKITKKMDSATILAMHQRGLSQNH